MQLTATTKVVAQFHDEALLELLPRGPHQTGSIYDEILHTVTDMGTQAHQTLMMSRERFEWEKQRAARVALINAGLNVDLVGRRLTGRFRDEVLRVAGWIMRMALAKEVGRAFW